MTTETVLTEGEKMLNVILVKNNVIGVFYSFCHWSKLGSKRSLCELVTGQYICESDIDIVQQHASVIKIIL